MQTWPQKSSLEILLAAVLLAAAAAVPVVFPLLLEDPGMAQVGDLGHQGQVVAAETRGVLPLVAVLVETRDVTSKVKGVVRDDAML